MPSRKASDIPATSRRSWTTTICRAFRDRFNMPVSDEDISKVPFCRPPEDSRRARVHEGNVASDSAVTCRNAGPRRRRSPAPALESRSNPSSRAPASVKRRRQWPSSAFCRRVLKDENVGKAVVPIVPDEARTFGMEGLFRQVGIYSSKGQLYTISGRCDQLMFYREDKKGQILEEGINEAGSMCSTGSPPGRRTAITAFR